MNKEPSTHLFKVVLLGEASSGKTAWLTSITKGGYQKDYVPTKGVDVHFLSYNTTTGNTVNLSIWDTAGQEELSGLKEGYYPGAHAALIFIDGNKREMVRELEYRKWANTYERVCPDTPILAVVTKADSYNFKAPPVPHRFGNAVISTRTHMGTHVVLRLLARTLLRDPTLVFTNVTRPIHQVDWTDLLVERTIAAIRDEREHANTVSASS